MADQARHDAQRRAATQPTASDPRFAAYLCPMSTPQLIIYRASRLEGLLLPLRLLLAQYPPPHVLAPQTVVAAHPGMRPWLSRSLAEAEGQGGVLANVQVKLASAWLDELTQRLLGQRATALPNYRRQHLRWSIDALLQDAEQQGIRSAQALHYLQQGGTESGTDAGQGLSADELALRRFQLADRLAVVFSQYMIYRPDWLAGWEAGRLPATAGLPPEGAWHGLEAELLAPLWRALQSRLGAYRSALMQQLQEALAAHTADLPPLHAFGLAHLPPQELDLLAHYARKAPVFLYVPDPCREYWGGLHKADAQAADLWAQFRAEEGQRLALGSSAFAEQGHPLLAQWGRMGQHFFASLAELHAQEDMRHGADESPDAAPQNRLERLQQSLRELDVGRIQESEFGDAERRADASLRIHACHTPLRELEVLRDALLSALDAGVAPDEMVVMAPNIAAYAPLIPAVFGSERLRQLLPYRLADLPQAGQHALLQMFQSLLALGGSRLGLPQLQQWLRTPVLAQGLGLAAEEAELLCQRLQQARVAWGFDAQHKADRGLPPRSEFSLAWGLDRMLAAYVMGGPAPAALHLPDGTELLPAGPWAAGQAEALGALERLLQQLQQWRKLGQKARTGAAWAAKLRSLLAALFAPSQGQDADTTAAWAAIERALAQLENEPQHNSAALGDASGQGPELRLAVVRELVEESLNAPPQQQRFLGGGITFCGMVPQRAIPFQFVAVLGLNEGEFPRRRPDGGVDLMARLRRLGDRDEPTDDRYLFLETLMSARQRLHLSYMGRGVQDDKERNPAAPLAELLAELQKQNPPPSNAPPRQAQPWLVQHPLQAFDARYFDGQDPALYAYAAQWAELGGLTSAETPPLPNLRSMGLLPQEGPWPSQVQGQDVARWFKSPAEALFKQSLHAHLNAMDAHEQAAEDEPLDAAFPAIERVSQRLLLELALPAWLAAGADEAAAKALPLTQPDWLRLGGLLPLGHAGQTLWQKEEESLRAMLAAAAGQPSLLSLGAALADGAALPQHSISYSLHLPCPQAEGGALQVNAQARGLYPYTCADTGRQGWQWLRPYPNKKRHELGLREALGDWLPWLMLRLHLPPETALHVCQWLPDGVSDFSHNWAAWDARYGQAGPTEQAALKQDLQQRLLGLIALQQKGLRGGSYFHPRTASVLLQEWQAVLKKCQGDEAQAFNTVLQGGKVMVAWAGTAQSTGERDYSPGYARLLEGRLIFGQASTDPQHHALHALLQEALQLQALLHLPTPHASEAGAAGKTNNSKEAQA